MKQFLKSTAIFACMAFLFCACGDDGTEDAVVSTTSGVSSFRLLQAGEERAWVKWTVPSNDNITSCRISWVGEGVSDAIQVNATQGIMEAKIGEAFTNIVTGRYTNLPAGTYTFTVKSLNGSGSVLGEDSKELYVYDKDTYTERPEIAEILVDEEGAWITCGNVPQDCIGIRITYKDSSLGISNDTDLLPVVEGVPINIANATPNTPFTFKTYFKPNEGKTNEGLDVIELDNDDSKDYMIPSLIPTSARNVSSLPGDGRFVVYWNVPMVADITSSYIEYTNESGEVAKVEIKGSELKKGLGSDKINKSEFRNLPSGDYTVTIYNISNASEISDPESTQVTVYNAESYATGAAIKQAITLNSVGQAEIAWDYTAVSAEALADCWGVIAKAGSENSAQESDLAFSEPNTWSYIDGMTGGEAVSYTTYFRPYNGLDFIKQEVTDDVNKLVATTKSPDKPTNVVFSPGNYSLFFEFDLTSDASISKVVIDYANANDSDDQINKGSVVFDKDNFVLGRDNFIGIGLEEGLKLNYEYDVKIWTENSAGVKSGYESADALLVYDFGEFQSDCVMPSFTYDFGVAYPYGIEMNWVDTGCKYVDFTYVYNTAGDTKTVRIESFDIPTIIPDVMPGNDYSWQATFIPAPNAMNNYVISRSSSSPFPYVGIDKSQIKQYPGMLCEAEEAEGDVNYLGFDKIFDDIVSASTTSSAAAIDYVGKYITVSDQANKTLSYDLGATYKLAEFYYTPYMGYVAHSAGIESSTLNYNYTITEFSLYGTNMDDPANNGSYNRLNDDGTPNWEDWDCLLDHQVVKDLSNELYAFDLSNDYNGDGVVDSSDMTWAVSNGGFPFPIPEENRVPVRYLCIQFHKAANYDTAYASESYVNDRDVFMIVELNHTHMGCDVE